MGHGKLKKFAENETFRCLLQPETSDVIEINPDGTGLVLKEYPIKGEWNSNVFKSEKPIILELGCGRGEYTVDLATRNPDCNYIGVDIKGARLWKGAKHVTENGISNAAFLRTRIEFIEAFFAPGEISEIWLTFSDPQLKNENSRLTSPRFLERYRKFLKPGGIIHLKTDSQFLHHYSKEIAQQNGLRILACTDDLYSDESRKSLYDSGIASVCGKDAVDALFDVRTYYENMFLGMGLKITYLSFTIDHEGEYKSPQWDQDYWKEAEGKRRSFGHQPQPQTNK